MQIIMNKSIATIIVFALTAAALIFCSAATAQTYKPKVAVYVDSDKADSGKKKTLEAKISNAFVQSGRFRIIDRSDVSLNKLSAEMKKQRDGSVNSKQISRLGRQAGVDYVCVVYLVYSEKQTDSYWENGSGDHVYIIKYNVSARLIDTEEAEIVASGEKSEWETAAHSVYYEETIGKVVEYVFSQIMNSF